MSNSNKHPPGEPMTLGNVTNTEDYYQLAAQEAALARAPFQMKAGLTIMRWPPTTRA
jgi:hypothetical protein